MADESSGACPDAVCPKCAEALARRNLAAGLRGDIAVARHLALDLRRWPLGEDHLRDGIRLLQQVEGREDAPADVQARVEIWRIQTRRELARRRFQLWLAGAMAALLTIVTMAAMAQVHALQLMAYAGAVVMGALLPFATLSTADGWRRRQALAATHAAEVQRAEAGE